MSSYPAFPNRTFPGFTGGSTGGSGGTASDYALGAAGSETKMSAIERRIEEVQEQVGAEMRLAGGALMQDLTATKRRWRFRYAWLAADTDNVEDSGLGRDDLQALYAAGSSLNLKEPLEDGTRDNHTVRFVHGSWVERRIQAAPHWIYELEFELVEV